MENERFGPMSGNDVSGLIFVIMVLCGPPGWLILLLCAPFWAIGAALRPKRKPPSDPRNSPGAIASHAEAVRRYELEKKRRENDNPFSPANIELAMRHGWKLP